MSRSAVFIKIQNVSSIRSNWTGCSPIRPWAKTQRPQFDALPSFAREGDTVVVHSMDRLARNLDDLRRLVQTLIKRGIRIEFVKECLSFAGKDSPMANLLLSVMGRSRSLSGPLSASGSAKESH